MTSIWISLKNRTFRNLWGASLLSGSAVSAYDMAATWLMNTMAPSPLFLSLISTFATLPFFLFTLPAGALADMFDRRKRHSEDACEVLSEHSDNFGDCVADFGLFLEGLRFAAKSHSLGRWGGRRCLDRRRFGALASRPDCRPGVGERPTECRLYDGVEREYGDWRNSLGCEYSGQRFRVYVARLLNSSPSHPTVASPLFYRRGSGGWQA